MRTACASRSACGPGTTSWSSGTSSSPTHRHFGFFWLPTEESAALYNLHGEPGQTLTDQCYVKLFDEVGADVPDDDTPDRRVDRCYRIFPMVYDPNFHELEYFVRSRRARTRCAPCAS